MAIDTTEITKIENPFQHIQVDDRLSAGAIAIESQRAIAEVQGAMVMAKKCPRNKFVATEKILETCRRADFAKTALYRYPRGNESISGLTIRAAEVILNAWGNAIAELLEISQADGESEWMARVWDLETGTQYRRSFRFRHERHTNAGTKILKDPRDIYELGANYGQRRLRALILELVDDDVVRAAEEQVRATLVASVGGGGKTLAEKSTAMVTQFNKHGVKVKHIEKFLGHSIEDLTAEEYADLATIFVGIKDKIADPADYFDLPKGTTTSEAAKSLDDALVSDKPVSPTSDNPEEDIRQGLIAEAHRVLEGKYKSQALRDTAISKVIGDTPIENASVDQLNALIDSIR